MGHRGRQKTRSRKGRRKGSQAQRVGSAGGTQRSQRKLEGGLGIVLIGLIVLMIVVFVIARIIL